MPRSAKQNLPGTITPSKRCLSISRLPGSSSGYAHSPMGMSPYTARVRGAGPGGGDSNGVDSFWLGKASPGLPADATTVPMGRKNGPIHAGERVPMERLLRLMSAAAIAPGKTARGPAVHESLLFARESQHDPFHLQHYPTVLSRAKKTGAANRIKPCPPGEHN